MPDFGPGLLNPLGGQLPIIALGRVDILSVEGLAFGVSVGVSRCR
jgi:hypothetical protein